MAIDSVVRHDCDGTIQLLDGTGTPVTLDVPFSQGDFSLSGLSKEQREVVAYQSRGTLHSIRLGDKTFPTVSFSAMLSNLTDATLTTALDFLRKAGSYSSNATQSTNSAEVFTVGMKLTIEGTDHGASKDDVITLTNVACTFDVGEGRPNTLTVNGTVYGTVAMA